MINIFKGALLLIVMNLCVRAWSAEPGLVAHWDFNEGSGVVLRDTSGHGNDGKNHGAQYVARGKGYCLEFDGVDDYVDCGDKPDLDLHEQVTIEAWIYPDSRVIGEPGILGKHFTSYLLTYYADGKCWWYIGEGANNAKNLLTAGSWHHVVCTFDGTTMRLYIDGKLADTNVSKHKTINKGKNFFIGCVVGDPNATDPAYTQTKYFPGLIDEVSVYNRALADSEVSEHFRSGVKDLDLMAKYPTIKSLETLKSKGVAVKVSSEGAVQMDTGNESYLVESSYSYPGERLGWNRLASSGSGGEPNWKPKVRRKGDAIEIEAGGRFYNLLRRVRIGKGRIEFEDTLTNVRSEPTPVIVWNNLTSPQAFRETFTPGGAEVPLIYLSGEKDALGVVAEDNLSRLRFEPSVGVPANLARFRVSNFALDVGKSCTLRWSVYLLDKGADYFDLVNRVRKDWNSTFTLSGPFSFFDMNSSLLDQPEDLKAYLQRKHLGVVALSPWLDYDPGSSDRVWSREEYKVKAQKAIRALKAADPKIKCVGSIETDWVTLDPAKIKGGEKIPNYLTGSGMLNAEQTRILDDANLLWKDSVKRREDGNLTLELYMRGGKPQTALSVYPAIGNYQFEFLMGQVKFLLDEAGTDGFYIDEFSQGWGGGFPSYEGWDGVSVATDSRSGEIRRKYVDCSLAGIEARVKLVDYALKRGCVVIANTYSTSMDEQSLPVNRFSETWGSFDPMLTPDGVEPPPIADLFRGNLASPIGLGILGKPEKKDTARRMMKAVATYLRHGTLFYHYYLEDIPELGPGSGEYGPVNHTFPITPLELHKGWVLGKERILTCVSGKYDWKHPDKPKVYRFDLDGREAPTAFPVTRTIEGWQIDVKIKDWAEIVVVE